MGEVYVYGVIDQVASDESNLGIVGLDGASPVEVVSWGGIGAVLSSYTAEDIRAVPREKLLHYLLCSQQVAEHVMEGHTVLPVKFWTTMSSIDEIRAMLWHGYQDLARALRGMQNKVEIEVAATWDLDRVIQRVGYEEGVARARQATAAAPGLGLEEKLKIGRMVKELVDRRREAHRERVLGLLRPLAVDVVPHAVLAEEMVMNLAFLVDKARQEHFDQGLHDLDSLFQHEVTFRVIGPLPPYSFSTVKVGRWTRSQREEARKTLKLAGAVSEARVRTAYRHLAAQAQRNGLLPGGPSGDCLAALRDASEVLLACCRVQRASGGLGGDGFSLEDRGDLYTVAIEKARADDVAPARFGHPLGV